MQFTIAIPAMATLCLAATIGRPESLNIVLLVSNLSTPLAGVFQNSALARAIDKRLQENALFFYEISDPFFRFLRLLDISELTRISE